MEMQGKKASQNCNVWVIHEDFKMFFYEVVASVDALLRLVA
jgi:hypothetical protein